MEFLPKEIEDYAEAHTDAASELLRYVDRQTHANVLRPRMLSGQLQGRMLALFSRLIRPRRVLEIGTYTGYSALCLCEGLTINGKLITIDIDEELETFTRNVFEKSEYHDRIDFRIGAATDIVPTLDDTFDLVFIDADKTNYLAYYDMVLPKIRPGGLIIADNVLWSGKVVESFAGKTDKETTALLDFNRYVHNDPRVRNLLLPVRDGVMMAQLL